MGDIVSISEKNWEIKDYICRFGKQWVYVLKDENDERIRLEPNSLDKIVEKEVEPYLNLMKFS